MSAHAIVLAAGKGTRMKSARPKVLHELCGRPMLWWGLDALARAGVDSITVVTNPELEAQFAATPLLADFDAQTVVQPEQSGTGDAVRVALASMPPRDGAVIVTYGDMPLIDESLLRAVTARADEAARPRSGAGHRPHAAAVDVWAVVAQRQAGRSGSSRRATARLKSSRSTR